MYVFQTLLIICVVYLAPALALHPKLILNPTTFIAIPFLSAIYILIIQYSMNFIGFYDSRMVQMVSALIFMAAITRTVKTITTGGSSFEWNESSRFIFSINLILIIYIGARLLIHGFDSHDEIYSWNMWAIQHYLGEEIDFYYTQSPYPQFFPKLLSYCYMILGSIEAQTAVKTALIIFPFMVFCIIGLIPSLHTNKILFLHVASILFLLQGLKLDKVFSVGMPDLLVTAAVSASMFFLIKFRAQPKSLHLLAFSIICSIAASLSKQPGLILAVFSLPALLLLDAVKKRIRWKVAALGIIPQIIAIAWIFTEGKDFHDNKGVIERSFDDRDTISQLAFSIENNLVSEPSILILIIFTLVALFRAKKGIDIFLLFVAPSIAAWLIYASYDIRAGAPALVTMILLIAYCDYGIRNSSTVITNKNLSQQVMPRIILLFLSLTISLAGAITTINKTKNQFKAYTLGLSRLNNIIRTFGDDGVDIFSRIQGKDEITLWTPTNYVYGLFYGYVNVIRPQYSEHYNEKTLLKELQKYKPDYVTNSGNVPYGPGGVILDKLANSICPELFERVAGPNNKASISIYKLKKEMIEPGYCNP